MVVHVRPHPLFGQTGKHDLTVRVPITFAEATLGAQVKVPTLGEPVTVKVAPGTPSGKTVRVRSRGIQPAKGDPGDLLVSFDVVVPTQLSSEQREAIEKLATTLTADPREQLGV